MSNHKQNIIVNYGFRCHGDQRYNHTARPDRTRTYLDGFLKCINSISRNHMIGQTVPYRNYSICEIKVP